MLETASSTVDSKKDSSNENDQIFPAKLGTRISLFNKPLNLIDLTTKQELSKLEINSEYECFLCSQKFNILDENNKTYLTHLLIAHKLVISDVDQIGDFEKWMF
jgi:hypothetical protein